MNDGKLNEQIKENMKALSSIMSIAVLCVFTFSVFNILYQIYDKHAFYPIVIIIVGYTIVYIIYRIAKLILRGVTSIENKFDKVINDNDLIYVRDIESPLSPACVSYLMNNKIEFRKDIVATILILIAKKQLVINDELAIVSSNNINSSLLTDDERYVYEWVINEKDDFDRGRFLNIVKDELKRYVYVKRNNIRLNILFFIVFGAGIFINGILSSIGLLSENVQSIIILICLASFILAFVFSIISNIGDGYIGDNNYFSYTKKGVQEALNWAKFKKFMEDFGRLHKVELESVILWDKYLAYAIALNINRDYKNIKAKDAGSNFKINLDKIIESKLPFGLDSEE